MSILRDRSKELFMVVVDAHSKWLEVILMSSTTTEKTIAVLSNLFASYGSPEQLVSDNGLQLTTHEFIEFMKANWSEAFEQCHTK